MPSSAGVAVAGRAVAVDSGSGVGGCEEAGAIVGCGDGGRVGVDVGTTVAVGVDSGVSVAASEHAIVTMIRKRGTHRGETIRAMLWILITCQRL